MIQRKYTKAPDTLSETLRQLTIMRLAFASGCFIFLGIVVYLMEVEKQVPPLSLRDNVILVVDAGLLLLSILLRKLLTEKKYAAIDPLGDVKYKLAQYKSIIILNFALIEFPVLAFIISYLLTGNRIFAIVAPILILQFFMIKISSERITTKLQLSTDEVSRL